MYRIYKGTFDYFCFHLNDERNVCVTFLSNKSNTQLRGVSIFMTKIFFKYIRLGESANITNSPSSLRVTTEFKPNVFNVNSFLICLIKVQRRIVCAVAEQSHCSLHVKELKVTTT